MTRRRAGRFRYQPFPDLDLPLAARLGQYPRQPDLLLDASRVVARTIAAGLFRAQFHLQVVGQPPNLPRVAIMANHQSHLDTFAILAALPEQYRRRVTVLAARDYFFEHACSALAVNLFGQAVAFDRGAELSELRRWAALLPRVDAGWFLCYPSGSRKRVEPHAGLAGVLARSGWAVLPVALAGTAEAWPIGRPVWRPFRTIRVTFGDPITDADERDLPGQLLAFWSEHGQLGGAPAGARSTTPASVPAGAGGATAADARPTTAGVPGGAQETTPTNARQTSTGAPAPTSARQGDTR
jgi:1-acyl-sn-glycerol-3-phosphate acyltransferase